MASNDIRKRTSNAIPQSVSSIVTDAAKIPEEPHPAGEVKHNVPMQILRLLLLATWFIGCCIVINCTILIGAPLYFVSRDYYYAWMAMCKQSFSIVFLAGTQVFSPTLVRVSWDASLRGQFSRTADGKLETSFPERLVLIANHQIYTDWIYLWWTAYTSRMHGHVYIILKDSLKYIPILSPGVLFFGFIFVARKWAEDKSKIQYRLQKLITRHAGPMSGSAGLDPMWLLIFPEGTNLSRNTRKKSLAWAQKQGIQDPEYVLLPRSTGLHYCLEELKDTVEWVYDCTVTYEGVPKDTVAPDFFTIRSVYLQGRPPKSANMYWRRFAVSSIPVHDQKAFEAWVLERWREKDALIEQYYETGRFPADNISAHEKSNIKDGYIETEVRVKSWLEIGSIFVVLAALALIVNVFTKLYEIFF